MPSAPIAGESSASTRAFPLVGSVRVHGSDEADFRDGIYIPSRKFGFIAA